MYWHGGVCTVCIYALEDEQDLHKKGENQPEEIESIMYGTGRVIDTCSSPVHAGCRHSFFVLRALPAQRMWPEGRRLLQTTSCIHSRSGFHRATRQQLLSMRTSTPLPHASQVLTIAMGRTRLHVLTPHKRQNGRDAVKSERGCNHAALLHFLCTSTSRQRECLLY